MGHDVGPTIMTSPGVRLTDSKLSLLIVLLQVNLDTGFEEVQLCLQLLGQGSH